MTNFEFIKGLGEKQMAAFLSMVENPEYPKECVEENYKWLLSERENSEEIEKEFGKIARKL